MRKIIGPVILVALAAASLLFLQHRDPSHSGGAVTSPSVTAPAPSRTLPPPPATPPATQTTAPPTVSPADPEPDGSPLPSTAVAKPRGQAQAARFARAMRTATAFMKAFARPSTQTGDATWWSQVKPYLSAQAAADYEGTDPRSVPFTRITGPVSVIPTDAPADLLTAVRVPTDAGDYVVELRTTATGMEVARAVPPTDGGAP